MNAPGERTLKVGHGVFDPLRGELVLGEHCVKLRPRTAVLLSYLVQHAGRAVSKEELMQAVWPDVVVTEDSLVQCVKEIRQALGETGRRLPAEPLVDRAAAWSAKRSALEHIWEQRGDRSSEIRHLQTAPQPKAEMSLLGG